MFEEYNDVVTVSEIAEMLRTKPYKVYKYIQNGVLRRLNTGKPYVVPKKEVIRFVQESTIDTVSVQ